jgi:hypothetical protein
MTSAPRRSAEAAAFAAALTLAAQAGAEAVVGPQIEWLVQGLFCAPEETGRREAPDTMSGWIHVPDEPVPMIAEGTVAPAVLGMGFGVRFQRKGLGLAELRYEVHHPPMGATGTTRQGWDSLSAAGAPDSIFFQFDLPEELVLGPWEFRAYEGGREIFRAPFTVVPAGDLPEVVALCRPGALMSALPGTFAPG